MQAKKRSPLYHHECMLKGFTYKIFNKATKIIKPTVEEITYSPDHTLFPVPTKTDMAQPLETG